MGGGAPYLVIDPLYLRFPGLMAKGYRKTSEATVQYNCVAHALYRSDKFMWPVAPYYWPADVPKEETVDALVALFQSLGYELCASADVEDTFEKVAIYALNGKPTHAARQLSTGAWTSKLGSSIDIEHATPEALNGRGFLHYGEPVRFMKRPRDPSRY